MCGASCIIAKVQWGEALIFFSLLSFPMHKYQLIIISLIIAFISSFVLNLILISSVYSMFRLRAIPPFPLYDENRAYVIRKSEVGYYFVESKYGNTVDRAYIGSTKIPLDDFAGKAVHIIGTFRPILGFPTCYKKCEFKVLAPVIDVEDLVY